jgi:hypothetical protein
MEKTRAPQREREFNQPGILKRPGSSWGRGGRAFLLVGLLLLLSFLFVLRTLITHEILLLQTNANLTVHQLL